MTIGPREKRLALGLVGVVALGLAVRASNRGGDEVPEAARRGPAAAAAANAQPPVREAAAVDLAALRPQSSRFTIGRDPFNFVPDPTPTPPPPPPPPPTPKPFVGPVQPPPPPRPVPPSPDHLHYLGCFGPEESRIAVINSGKEIFNVHQGAVLEGKFIVQEIGYESVAIAFVGFPDEPPRRLPAGGGAAGGQQR